MSTISDQLTLLNNTKTAIRTAINNKGGSVGASDTFASYATAITNLPSGGDNSTLIDLIEGDITSINIPSGTTGIKAGAFQNCTSLTSISIPNTVTSFGNNAFSNCRALQSINIPSSVTTLGIQCFSACNLTSITIPDSVTTIPSYIVNYCNNLTKIIVGNNVSTIQSGAFSTSGNNFVLSVIVINTTTVPNLQSTDAFNYTHNCPIYVPAESLNAYKTGYRWSTYASRIYPIQQVATVDGNPVYNYDLGNTDSTVISDNERSKIPTGDVLEFSEGLEEIGGQLGAYEEVIMPSTFKSFDDTQPINAATTTLTCKATIPPGVEGNNLGGSGLTAIYVPSAKVDAYKSAAWGWSTFASIIQAIPEDVKPAFKFTSSVDSSKDITVNCEDTATAGTLTTNDLGMSSQQMDEFKSAENTGSVEIGDCVKIYRATNCYTAKGISEVKLNEGLERIEDFAFGGMSALREITIPSTVTNISYQAFYADRALQGITCLATTPPTLGSDVFGDTNNCPIYVPAESVDTYKTAWTQYADRIEPI